MQHRIVERKSRIFVVVFAAIAAVWIGDRSDAIGDDRPATSELRSQVRILSPRDDAETALEELLGLIRRRLALMHDVARAKWNAKALVEDPRREQALLQEVEKKGLALGLEPAFTRAFFAAQIEAAKLIQGSDLRLWESERRGPFADAPDLKRDLRPRIDGLNADLLACLVKARPLLRGREPIVRRLGGEILVGDGIDAKVRDTAIRPIIGMDRNDRNAAPASRSVSPSEVMPGVRDYGYLWWADGWKGRSTDGSRILCVRTGHYGLALDVERLRVLHLGAIKHETPARDAVSEDNATVFALPAAELDLRVNLGGHRFHCAGVEPGIERRLRVPLAPGRERQRGPAFRLPAAGLRG